MRIDAHLHLWEKSPFPKMDAFRFSDWSACAKHVDSGMAGIYVECLANYSVDEYGNPSSVGETAFAARTARASLADDGPYLCGIVGFVDLFRLHDCPDRIEKHILAGEGWLRGIRHATAWDENKSIPNGHAGAASGAMTSKGFVSGLGILARLGLTFDAWCYFHQLPEVEYVAKLYPHLRIVVNHLGGPLGAGPYSNLAESRSKWRRAVTSLARHPNVYLKIGGIGMTLFGGANAHGRSVSAQPDSWTECVTFAIELFGPDRCMFESNYPVDGITLSYVDIWSFFQRVSSSYSPSEQASLFSNSARDAYGIPDQHLRRGP